jgi:DNA polymerase alpha subunit B
VTTSEDDFLNVNQRFRYMFTPLDERARNLDKHLLSLQRDMCEMASIDETTLQQVGVPSQDLVWVCGRIVCESAEGRINRQSVMLEGSRKESAGRRVHLDLSDMSGIPFSLFPGQIVLVEGINSSGRKMMARRIVEGVAKPMLSSKPSLLLDYHHSKHYQGGQALSVVTAAGPFTTSDNLDYQPLQDLLVHVLETKPDVLILVGPFVDISQPLLSNGHVVLTNDDEDGGEGGLATQRTHLASYEMVFVEKVVRDCLGQMFNSEDDFGGHLPTNIVLVPSLLDGHHEFVFPQPPFGDRDKVDTEFFKEPLGVLDIPFSREADQRRRVHLMPNPCMFRVNEVLFGVSSNDVLFSLSSDEVSQHIDGNRLVRLGSHLLQQQSFSPQFPVQTNTLSQVGIFRLFHLGLALILLFCRTVRLTPVAPLGI